MDAFSVDRFREALAERYTVESEIGQGGMATVFRAVDLRHNRAVAIKVMDPKLSTTIGLERFLQEIEVVAKLQHPNLLTLIDSGDVDGVPYYIMPLVEARSLRDHLEHEGRLPIEEAVRIAREVLDGLHYAHQSGVFHRDIKPSNILMSGGHAMVADFGIAMALERARVGRLTTAGVSLGSPIYMSPEQATGEADPDARCDIYSVGCVLYEMLCGGPPIEPGSMTRVLSDKLLGRFPSAREVRPDIPVALDAALAGALAVQSEDRHPDALAFSEALKRAMLPSPERLSKRTITSVLVVVVVLAAALSYGLSQAGSQRAVELARDLGEIERLAEQGAYGPAFVMAEEVARRAPMDTTMARLRPLFTDYVQVATAPAGARVLQRAYGVPDAEWEDLGVTPLDSLAVPKYGIAVARLLRFELAGYQPVELLPHVLSDWADWRGVARLDTVRLDPVEVLPDGMVRIPAFTMADNLHPSGGVLSVGDYFIDRNEVSNVQYAAFLRAGGYQDPTFWAEPFEEGGSAVPWAEAIGRLTDRTGRPGPSTWELGTFPEGQEDYPVGGLSWYEAAAYAQFVGKELPSSWHWHRAALRHSRETSWIYLPEANLGGPGPRPVGRAMGAYGLNDFAGNVREWMQNETGGGRIVRGGSWIDSEFHVGWRQEASAWDRSAQNGLRLVRQSEPDTAMAHFHAAIDPPPVRDFTNAVPAPEAEVRLYLRLFDYDTLALEADSESLVSTRHYRMEKATFTAAYGGEDMGAYVFLPVDAAPPYQPIIYWPGSGAMTSPSLDHESWIQHRVDFVPRSGRALIVPLFKGAFERDDADFSTRMSMPRPGTTYRDLAIQWVKDLRRTIDWLESREDMDADRVGLYGLSWGSYIAPLALAAEPRLKAAALNIGGLWQGGIPAPEVEVLNYLPLTTQPVLMLNGRYDVVFPYETTQLPFLNLLGTPTDQKEHYVYPTSHSVPSEELIPLVLDWFDRYLGPVGR